LESARIKAGRKMLMELTPGVLLCDPKTICYHMQCKSFFDQFLQMLLSKTFTDKIEEKSFRILLCEKEFFFHISNILNFSVKRVGSHFFHTDGIPFEKESKLKLFIFNL